jgi:hypothetical protein
VSSLNSRISFTTSFLDLLRFLRSLTDITNSSLSSLISYKISSSGIEIESFYEDYYYGGYSGEIDVVTSFLSISNGGGDTT